MDTSVAKNSTRGTAMNVLAGAGFIALVALGIWLAVYSTRFVPPVVNSIGSAAVYLGSVFAPAPAGAPLATVSTSTAPATTIRLGGETATARPATTARRQTATTAGVASNNVYQIGTSTASGAAALSGLPDLITTITAVGYLTSTSTDSFVASSTVPAGSRVAVRFTIQNIGTNATGAWRWSASIPTETAYIYQSRPQQSLAPGDRIDYTLGFDQTTPGADKMISITANFDYAVAESNPNNNSASAKITVLGN